MGYRASLDYSPDPALESFPAMKDRSRVVRKNQILAESESGAAGEFSAALGAKVPSSWPPHQQPARPGGERLRWNNYYYVPTEDGERVLGGSMGLAMWPRGERTVEFGGSLLPEFQGAGHAAEVCRLVGEWAEAHPDIDRIVCDVAAENRAMAKCLERAGYSREEEAPAHGFVRFYKLVTSRRK